MIRFPNEHVNVNKLDTYQHILTHWLPKTEEQWQSEPKRSKFA